MQRDLGSRWRRWRQRWRRAQRPRRPLRMGRRVRVCRRIRGPVRRWLVVDSVEQSEHLTCCFLVHHRGVRRGVEAHHRSRTRLQHRAKLARWAGWRRLNLQVAEDLDRLRAQPCLRPTGDLDEHLAAPEFKDVRASGRVVRGELRERRRRIPLRLRLDE